MTSETQRLAELDEARRALNAAADATAAAYDAWMTNMVGGPSERSLQARWEKAHEAQNRAAGRLHTANRALGRPAAAD